MYTRPTIISTITATAQQPTGCGAPAAFLPAAKPVKSLPQRRTDVLQFREITLEDLPTIKHYVDCAGSRTCDFTIGGIYMWVNYFRYRFCVYADTLFIEGRSEDNRSLVAYTLPVGSLPLADAVGLLARHCRAKGHKLRLSAVPDDKLPLIAEAHAITDAEELTDWCDYLYDLQALAQLTGKKYGKKRNHVNRFMLDNPGARLEPLEPYLLPAVREAYGRWLSTDVPTAQSAIAESVEVMRVLANYEQMPFEGAVLRRADGGIVGFTIGEIVGDTLFVHIEKIDRTADGAGETIAHLFAAMMAERHPELRYANREEDCGDPGLRAAKQSWHPAALLRKFNVEI